jgi:hypothetical protein
MRTNKKAQQLSANQLPAFITALVFIGLTIGIGTILMSEFTSNKGIRDYVGYNETLTLVSKINTGLNCLPFDSFTDVCNTSFCYGLGNITLGTNVDGETQFIKLHDSMLAGDKYFNWSNGSYRVTYNCYTDTDASTATNETLNAIVGVVDWVDIIVVVAIAGLILGMVAFFGIKRGGAQ